MMLVADELINLKANSDRVLRNGWQECQHKELRGDCVMNCNSQVVKRTMYYVLEIEYGEGFVLLKEIVFIFDVDFDIGFLVWILNCESFL